MSKKSAETQKTGTAETIKLSGQAHATTSGNEEAKKGAQADWVSILGPEPMLVSKLLIENQVSRSVIEACDAYALILFQKGNSKKRQKHSG